jgi:hypothetical protein
MLERHCKYGYSNAMDAKLKQETEKYFKKEFADVLLKKLKDGHALSAFNVNPFLVTALSQGVLGEATPLNIAKSLLYPRVFGTSISTILGDKLQKFCIHLGARASGMQGMDIEFEEKSSGKQFILQLKAGSDTLNSGDVEPIVEKMNMAYRLLKRNWSAEMPIFGMGVLYGSYEDLSGHYRKIASSPVGGQPNATMLVGKDFWHSLTGDENFYADLISIFAELFEKEDNSSLFKKDLEILSGEIEARYFTDGKFDPKKF